MLALLTIPSDVIEDLAAEVERARVKFPSGYDLNMALMEEVGELAAAQLQHESPQRIRREAIQVMAMAFRILDEGDATRRHIDSCLSASITERSQK